MNKTETKAYNWLIEKQQLKPSQIVFASNKTPDFVTNTGDTYEVKRLYANSILFYENQIEHLSDNTNILIFADKSDEPYKNIKWKQLKNKKEFEGITIKIINPASTDEKIGCNITINSALNDEIKHYMIESGINLKADAIERILEEFFGLCEDSRNENIKTVAKEEVMQK